MVLACQGPGAVCDAAGILGMMWAKVLAGCWTSCQVLACLDSCQAATGAAQLDIPLLHDSKFVLDQSCLRTKGVWTNPCPVQC